MASFNGINSAEDVSSGFANLQLDNANGNQIKNESDSTAAATNLSPLGTGVKLSLLEQLRQYHAEKENLFEAKCREEEKERGNLNNAISPKLRFSYEKVPEKIRKVTQSLPIFSRRDELIKMVRENQMVIVMGATGSGKSTQIVQFLVEAGFCDDSGIIGITQPRRVAAKSLAKRVCEESGAKLGELVGFAVRFDRCLSGQTLVKYMTDGLLVKECTTDPNLRGYSVIVIDEAHERSIHTDVCFGLLKMAAEKRPDLKIIISSATLDQNRFSKYFNNAPVFTVEGRMYPVEIIYKPWPVATIIDGVVDTILDIQGTDEEGDILVFLSGQDEIEAVWDRLEERRHLNFSQKMLILPCYGALPLEDQQKIFDETPQGYRKIVLATNIAETSLTVDGIVFVIDSGYFKQNHYNIRTKIDTLLRIPITQFQAKQRMGRAGRTRPGKCYRMYSEHDYMNFKLAPAPEITRSNVESVILDLIALGISNPVEFDFMDSPSREALMESMEHLRELTALDSTYCLTPLGKTMASFPLEPPLSRVLIESAKLGCSTQVIKIVAMLSSQHQNIFKRDKKVRKQADMRRALFNQPEGDYLTLLKVFETWVINDMSPNWCRLNYIQERILEEAEEIRIQLQQIFESHQYKLSHAISNDPITKINIRKCFSAGYFRQVAKKKPVGHAYVALSGDGGKQEVFLHPTSSIFSRKEPWLIFHEVMVTTKAYMRGASAIEPEWIRQYAPEFANKLNRYHNMTL